jgi:hypothetical protein
MSKYPPPVMPTVEAFYGSGKQKPTAIILSPSFTTSEKGAALGVAMTWHSPSSPRDSGHYTVDEVQRFRTLPDKMIAGHWQHTQKNAIRIMVCAEPYSASTFWHDNIHLPVLHKTAELVAELTLAYNINVSYFTDGSFERWKKRSTRYRGGILVDTPEGWPWQRFYNEVMAQRALKTLI